MKTFLPLFSLLLIGAASVLSSILYLNESYTSSAVLTIIWFVGLTLWIGARGVKEGRAK